MSTQLTEDKILRRLDEARYDTMGIEGIEPVTVEEQPLFDEKTFTEYIQGESAFELDSRVALINQLQSNVYKEAVELSQRLDKPKGVSASGSINESKERRAGYVMSQVAKHAMSGAAKARLQELGESWDPSVPGTNTFQRLFESMKSTGNPTVDVIVYLCNLRLNELVKTDSWLSLLKDQNPTFAVEIEKWDNELAKKQRITFAEVNAMFKLDKAGDKPVSDSYKNNEKAARLTFEQQMSEFVAARAPMIVRIAKLDAPDLHPDTQLLTKFKLDEWEEKWREKYSTAFTEKELKSNISSFRRRQFKSLVFKMRDEEVKRYIEEGAEYKLNFTPSF
jgi:hypothetical protein